MYRVYLSKKAIKSLQKMDKASANLIKSWIAKNLENTDEPRKFGKSLKGNLKSYWRYRIGDYRLIAEINDKEVLILILNASHRKDIYM